MKKTLYTLIVAITVLALALPLASVSAATARTVTITEQQLNNAYRLRPLPHVRVSNVYADIQEGQVEVTATLTLENGEVYHVAGVFTPVVESGRIHWTLVSATVNGEPMTPEQQRIVGQIMDRASAPTLRTVVLRHIARHRFGPYTVTSVALSNDTMTIEVETAR